MKRRVATTQQGRPRYVRGSRMLRNVFLRLCNRSASPLAQMAAYMFEAGDMLGLCSLTADPFFYMWSGRDDLFRLDHQIASFFKKYRDLEAPVDRKGVAFDAWQRAEASCARVNAEFRKRWVGGSHSTFPVEEVLHLARRKVTEILGSVGPRDLDYIRDCARHGPGADLDLRRRYASLYGKYQQQGSITPTCCELFHTLYTSEGNEDVRVDFAEQAKLVRSSRLAFVPKTALKDRSICVEARWNLFLQLGIGGLLAKRLRRYGQDIQDQGRNMQAARRAYDEGLATLDLSAASDSVATNLVVDLLSSSDPFWLELLLKSRMVSTEYAGRTYRLEKISSMGNGYTFPLETLIFFALSYAACQFEKADTTKVQVYGDDIILPRVASSVLIEALTYLGFTVNTDKSYTSGVFYESCGQDFYRGREVRPFFVKKKVDTLEDAMVLHNQIVRWSRVPWLHGAYEQWSVEIARRCIIDEIPRQWRYCGPTYLGGVFHTAFDSWTVDMPRTLRLRERGIDGFICTGLLPTIGRSLAFGWEGHLYSKLSADLDSGNWIINPGGQDLSGVYRLGRQHAHYSEDFVLV